MKQFHGTVDELKAAIDACGLNGDWVERAENGGHQIDPQVIAAASA